MPAISNDWAPELKPEYKKEYYKELFNFVGHEYATREIFPPADDIFNAFHLTQSGCMIYGSPDLRSCPSCALDATLYAFSIIEISVDG